MNKTMILLKRLLLVICACLSLSPLIVWAEAETPEAAVYAALFEHLAHKGGALRPVVLGTRTSGQDEVFAAAGSTERMEEVLRNAVSEASPTLRTAFIGELKSAAPLKTHQLPSKSALKVQLVPQEELDELFQSNPKATAWSRFFQRFSETSSLMSLSHPVIDPLTQTALVYVGSSCGRLCGGGWLLFMTRHEGAWRVSREVRLWIA